MKRKPTENSGKNSGLTNLRPYPKGVSGNPGGRPRGSREFAELIAKETDNGLAMVEYALKVLRSKKSEPAEKWHAVEYLTERMLGRAPQHIELDAKAEDDDRSDVRERLRARIMALMRADVTPAGCESSSAPEGDKGDNPGLNRTETETCLERN